MRKFARFGALVTCAAALTVPVIVSTQTPAVSELIRQVGKDLGFEKSDLDKLMQGEIVSRDLKEDSKKELAVAVAMVVKAPFGEIFDRIQKGRIDEADKTILSHGAIPDGAVSAESFAILKFDPGELDKRDRWRPGGRESHAPIDAALRHLAVPTKGVDSPISAHNWVASGARYLVCSSPPFTEGKNS